LLFGKKPAQILGAGYAGASRVRVERCDNFVGYISNEDISHAVDDIASLRESTGVGKTRLGVGRRERAG